MNTELIAAAEYLADIAEDVIKNLLEEYAQNDDLAHFYSEELNAAVRLYRRAEMFAVNQRAIADKERSVESTRP